jgi:hypothetical protein
MNLSTVEHILAKNPAFTHGQIRWLLHNAVRNGLEANGAVIRLGRRVYLDQERFFVWIQNKSDKARIRESRKGGAS